MCMGFHACTRDPFQINPNIGISLVCYSPKLVEFFLRKPWVFFWIGKVCYDFLYTGT
jgi:hypothetical protein